MFATLFKSAFLSIVGNVLKETVLALVGKLPWTVLLERFLSRLLVWCLVKLRKLTTNHLWQGTLEDLIQSLTNPKLKLPKVAEQYQLMTSTKDGMESNH